MPTVALNPAAEAEAALRININGRVEVRPAEKSSVGLAATPVAYNNTHLFNFPTQGAFNASAIVGPGWQLFFYHAVTGAEEPVFADTGFILAHTQPVTADRRGQLPVIYIQENVPYRLVLKNEHGIEKHRVHSFTWPDVVQALSVVGSALSLEVALSVSSL